MTPALIVPPVYFHRPSLIGSTYDLYERSMLWAAPMPRCHDRRPQCDGHAGPGSGKWPLECRVDLCAIAVSLTPDRVSFESRAGAGEIEGAGFRGRHTYLTCGVRILPRQECTTRGYRKITWRVLVDPIGSLMVPGNPIECSETGTGRRQGLKDAYRSVVAIVNPAIGGTQLRQNVILIPRWLAKAPEPGSGHDFFRRERRGRRDAW